ncbi:MAG: heat-shock protein [Flavobacteriales bacterium]|nr:MAG: heat-shock protein [Flavobacteriales bacterium]
MEVASKHHATEDELQSEQKQVEAAQRDPAHFELLYNNYHERIFRYVYQRMDDKETAFDITQQVFLKALTNLKKYEFRGVPFGSWLFRIAYSEVNQAFRDKKAERTVNVESVQVYEIMEEAEENPTEEKHSQLIEALAELPEDDLQLIEMRYFEKRAFAEIGEILEITENNAKVKTYRIIEKLRKIIAPPQPSPVGREQKRLPNEINRKNMN